MQQKDVFYYVTMMNEYYAQPSLPPVMASDVIRGCYKFSSYPRMVDGGHSPKTYRSVTLPGSGAILTEVIQAARLLSSHGVDVEVFGAASWSELARDGQACARHLQAGTAGDTQPPITCGPLSRCGAKACRADY